MIQSTAVGGKNTVTNARGTNKVVLALEEAEQLACGQVARGTWRTQERP